ncbi:dihydrofolate reductase family protein [Cryobacterium tepidiphilum]|uniref:Dihydrofolate reductase n=1 Tax=Cryobacterium tepidiphilum TaxID=2486026 RepID=A0A3M8LED7_9MICO|nr:dihydrofolate reductase family protein [Cryobacterium tepidiphilum]RNE63810.1 dihydrofolate reductase [Cryobacterium tepidiphilum]
MATIYYAASSLDGFIADPDNSLSWLLTRDVDASGPMGYDAFIASVGALAMGATTYQWLLDHDDGRWPYAMPCWVFTHRDLLGRDGDIRFTSADPAAVHAEMAEAADEQNIWLVGGGDLVGQFADAGCLDEVWVQYAPVTLGSGAPLLPRRIEFRLEELAKNGEFACARLAVVG